MHFLYAFRKSVIKTNFRHVGLLVFPILVISASFLFPLIMARQSKWFGVNQLSGIDLFDLAQILLIAGLFFSGCFLLLRNDRWRLVGAVLILLLFFVFRSNTMNQDGQDLLWKIPADVDRVGAHVVHDEMLELYTHSVFWSALNELGNFSVALSYQILSVSSGLIFMLLLVTYTKERPSPLRDPTSKSNLMPYRTLYYYIGCARVQRPFIHWLVLRPTNSVVWSERTHHW